MKDFAFLYFWYESLFFKIIRIMLFIIFSYLLVSAILNKVYPNVAVIPFSFFLIFEIFVHFKIGRLMPKLMISQNLGEPLDSFSLESLGILETSSNTKNIIKELINLPAVKFIISKSDVLKKDLDFSNIDKKELIQKAFSTAKERGGKYVTTMDLFVASLLLTENKTKLLFNKKIKEEDIKNILVWAQDVYFKEELPKGADLDFAGEGFAEDWVYGWTVETQKYMRDLSQEFLKEKHQPIGRENEYNQMIEGLSKGGSVLLVGDVGSGKESAVRKLATESFKGKLVGNLFHQKIFQLMVDAFMAGAKEQGELEQRLNEMVEEVSHSGNVIMYVPEFQNIVGSTSFNLDISGAIIPYLKRNSIRIVAAVTPGAYKKFIEPMHSLLDTFTIINFDTPSKEKVLSMLFIRAASIEEKNNVTLTYKALVAAFEYSDKYAKEKALPGSAVDLLDDTSNAVRLSGGKIVLEQNVLDQVERKTKVAVGEPKALEKELLLNLENELHKRVVDQETAVSSIAQAIRRLRAGLKTTQKPISFLFLGPTGVGKTETAKALADIYFGKGARLIRIDMSEYAGDDGMRRLLGSPAGQGDEKGQLTEPVYDTPYSLVLLDEFEKADYKITDLFLQVLDDGRLTDNKGKTVSFVNTIIIATSNAASEFIREEVEKGTAIDKGFHNTLLTYLQTKNIFKPELLNRFDDIIVFEPLGEKQVIQIVQMLLLEVEKNLVTKDIKVSFDEKVVQKIAKEGFDKQFGARPLRRFIQDKIEDAVAQKMLKDEVKRGDSINITVDSSGNISL